ADIDAIHVHTYFAAWSEIGSEPQKWNPQTRETADHSMPYLLAAALLDGRITSASFDAERMCDPAIKRLMDRITVTESKEFTSQYPRKLVSQIEVVTKSGERSVEAAEYPRGHPENP